MGHFKRRRTKVANLCIRKMKEIPPMHKKLKIDTEAPLYPYAQLRLPSPGFPALC